jgi:ADP-heptose:LPS heptosyltransferase
MKRYREKFAPIIKQTPWVKAVIIYDENQHAHKKGKKV